MKECMHSSPPLKGVQYQCTNASQHSGIYKLSANVHSSLHKAQFNSTEGMSLHVESFTLIEEDIGVSNEYVNEFQEGNANHCTLIIADIPIIGPFGETIHKLNPSTVRFTFICHCLIPSYVITENLKMVL